MKNFKTEEKLLTKIGKEIEMGAGMDLGPDDISKVTEVLFLGIAKGLGMYKNADKPVSLAIRRSDNSFIFGARLEFVPELATEDASASWSLTFGFDEAEIVEGSTAIEFSTDNDIMSKICMVGLNKYHMRFCDPVNTKTGFGYILQSIFHYLRDNVTEDSNIELELDTVFVMSAGVEDGKVSISIEAGSETKKYIKDDDVSSSQAA